MTDFGQFERIWVVQCKFHIRDISTDKISDVNIPSLLHSYKANGYLLICRTRPTSKLTVLLERLEENCIFGYKYNCWTGETFKRRLTKTANILTQFNLTI